MRLKRKHLFLLLSGIVLLNGCGAQTDEAVTSFPENYQATEDNVSYDFKLELPEDFDANDVKKVEVNNIISSDVEMALQLWDDGKEVVVSNIAPADQYTPEEHFYWYADNTRINVGGSSLSYSTQESDHYTRPFLRISEDVTVSHQPMPDFSFATANDCIADMGEVIKQVGYDITFLANSFSLDADQAKSWEEHLTMDDEREEESYKEAWSEEDNAYLISAYQTYQGLPIFNEMLAMNQSMAVDSPYNAPIQSIYTARGLEQLSVIAQYQFSETDQQITLLPFETIIKTITEKFNNTLSEQPYEVDKAKMFLMVRYVNARDYEALPIWYFEAKAVGGTDKLVVLVDAETGKEINVGI